MNERIELFGARIDVVKMSGAVERIMRWIAESDGHCRYVVTPNTDHAVMLQSRADLRDAYGAADLVLADGTPLIVASRLLGCPLPERVAGSDLVPALFAAADRTRSLRVFLLGAAAGVADTAARRIEHVWPAVDVVGTYSPPMGFQRDEEENGRILDAVAQSRPDLLVVGLGAPKQELWVHEHRRRLQASVALCAGATIDFLAGEKTRAPKWMQRVGMEWLHRVAAEPRRLLWRYAKDAWVFPQLVWRQWRAGSPAA